MFMMQCLVISCKGFGQILSLECSFKYNLNTVALNIFSIADTLLQILLNLFFFLYFAEGVKLPLSMP